MSRDAHVYTTDGIGQIPNAGKANFHVMVDVQSSVAFHCRDEKWRAANGIGCIDLVLVLLHDLTLIHVTRNHNVRITRQADQGCTTLATKMNNHDCVSALG